MRLKALAVVVTVAVLPLALLGQGYSSTHSLAEGTVTISNSQANSSWVPVSVMIRYDTASAGTAEVRRVSQGLSVVLAACTFTNVTSLVWVPASFYSFGYGDVLTIESSVTNGSAQVIRRGD